MELANQTAIEQYVNELRTGKKSKLRQRFIDNIFAMGVMQKIEKNPNQLINIEDRSLLTKYSGWGGLGKSFEKPNGDVEKGWEKEVALLSLVLDDETHARVKRSILSAYYTPEHVSLFISDALQKMGLKGGKILEPSIGIGSMVKPIMDALPEVKVVGIELDKTTAMIADSLYPNAKIVARGFQTFNTGSFDAVVTNPPFGDFKIVDSKHQELSDFNVHNYFLNKSAKLLKDEKGLMAIVVSNSFLDSITSSESRKMMAEDMGMNLVTAFRLPNDAFDDTQVTTDIIFMKKREHGEATNSDLWLNIGEMNDAPINKFYIDNPNNMLGEWGRFGTMYQGGLPALISRENQNTQEELHKKLSEIPSDILVQNPEAILIDDSPKYSEKVLLDGVKSGNNEFFVTDGTLYYKNASSRYEYEIEEYTHKINSKKEAVPLKEKEILAIKKMTIIKDECEALISMQLDEDVSDLSIDKQRAILNALYDDFTSDGKFLHSQSNRSLFRIDSRSSLLLSLEKEYSKAVSKAMSIKENIIQSKESCSKSDIFFMRTLYPNVTPASAKSIEESIDISIGMKGKVDIDYMAKLLDANREDLIVATDGFLLFNDAEDGSPEKWVSSEEYLSGAVKKKYISAPEKYKQKLQDVFPKDIKAGDIVVALGANWVGDHHYRDFVKELTESESDNISVTYLRSTSNWRVSNLNPSEAIISKIGTSRRKVEQVIESAMSNSPVIVKDKLKDDDGTVRYVVNKQETTVAQAKVDLVKREFKKWIFDDVDRRSDIVRKFNDIYNDSVQRNYNGDKLPFYGMNPLVKLRKYQSDSVAQMIQSKHKSLLLDLVVGSGKTFTMGATAMSLKNLGLIQKALIAIPNHIYEQFVEETVFLYPSAKIISPSKEDFSAQNRNKYLRSVSTTNFDIMIIPHSFIDLLPLSVDFQQRVVDEEIGNILGFIDDLELNGDDEQLVKRSVRQAELQIEKLENQFYSKIKDFDSNTVTIDDLGFDFLAIDELHEYKNLGFYTKLSDVRGLGNPAGSNKAFHLFMITRWMKEERDGYFMGATGTPISNSLVEVYNLFKYFRLDMLKDKQLDVFDSFAQFLDIKSVWETKTDGTYVSKSALAGFYNLPELANMYKEFTTTVSADDLKAFGVVVPEMKTFKEVIDRTPLVADYFGEPDENGNYPPDSLVGRGVALAKKKGRPKKGDDNHLVIISDAKKATTDIRMTLGDSLEMDEENSKLNKLVENVLFETRENSHQKFSQLVFCDFGISNKGGSKEKARLELEKAIMLADEGDTKSIKYLEGLSQSEIEIILNGDENLFSLYDTMKEKLIEGGLKPDEVMFIHDAKNEKQKLKLFSDVREGIVKVLIGTTQKMGTGMNVQRHLGVVHLFTIPWRPSDMEQAVGRMVRYGNSFDSVHLYQYAMKNTLDTRFYEILSIKSNFIKEFKNGMIDSKVRHMKGGDDAISFDEMKALSSNNPLMLSLMQTDMAFKNLSDLDYEHSMEQFRIKDRLSKYSSSIESSSEDIEDLRKDAKKSDDYFIEIQKRILAKTQQEDTIKEEKAQAKKDDVFYEEPAPLTIFEFKGKDGKVYVDRKDAGEYILSNLPHSNIPFLKIGEIGGFNVVLEPIKGIRSSAGLLEYHTVSIEGEDEYAFTITGATQSAIGLTQRLQNIIATIPTALVHKEIEIKRIQRELPKLKDLIGENPDKPLLEEITKIKDNLLSTLSIEGKKSPEQEELNKSLILFSDELIESKLEVSDFLREKLGLDLDVATVSLEDEEEQDKKEDLLAQDRDTLIKRIKETSVIEDEMNIDTFTNSLMHRDGEIISDALKPLAIKAYLDLHASSFSANVEEVTLREKQEKLQNAKEELASNSEHLSILDTLAKHKRESRDLNMQTKIDHLHRLIGKKSELTSNYGAKNFKNGILQDSDEYFFSFKVDDNLSVIEIKSYGYLVHYGKLSGSVKANLIEERAYDNLFDKGDYSIETYTQDDISVYFERLGSVDIKESPLVKNDGLLKSPSENNKEDFKENEILEEEPTEEDPQPKEMKLSRFIGKNQMSVMNNSGSEEIEYFKKIKKDILEVLDTMPVTYETDGMGDSSLVYLHYFNSSSDWYITERDVGDEQLQAFGMVSLNGGEFELGYINLEELASLDIEMDLNWTPKSLAKIKNPKLEEEIQNKEALTIDEMEQETLPYSQMSQSALIDNSISLNDSFRLRLQEAARSLNIDYSNLSSSQISLDLVDLNSDDFKDVIQRGLKSDNGENIVGLSLFGVKDELNPISEYIEEVFQSNAYQNFTEKLTPNQVSKKIMSEQSENNERVEAVLATKGYKEYLKIINPYIQTYNYLPAFNEPAKTLDISKEEASEFLKSEGFNLGSMVREEIYSSHIVEIFEDKMFNSVDSFINEYFSDLSTDSVREKLKIFLLDLSFEVPSVRDPLLFKKGLELSGVMASDDTYMSGYQNLRDFFHSQSLISKDEEIIDSPKEEEIKVEKEVVIFNSLKSLSSNGSSFKDFKEFQKWIKSGYDGENDLPSGGYDKLKLEVVLEDETQTNSIDLIIDGIGRVDIGITDGNFNPFKEDIKDYISKGYDVNQILLSEDEEPYIIDFLNILKNSPAHPLDEVAEFIENHGFSLVERIDNVARYDGIINNHQVFIDFEDSEVRAGSIGEGWARLSTDNYSLFDIQTLMREKLTPSIATIDNIETLYPSLSSEQKVLYSEMIGELFADRSQMITDELNLVGGWGSKNIQTEHVGDGISATRRSVFGIEDTLGDISSYIEEITATSQYREFAKINNIFKSEDGYTYNLINSEWVDGDGVFDDIDGYPVDVFGNRVSGAFIETTYRVLTVNVDGSEFTREFIKSEEEAEAYYFDMLIEAENPSESIAKIELQENEVSIRSQKFKDISLSDGELVKSYPSLSSKDKEISKVRLNALFAMRADYIADMMGMEQNFIKNGGVQTSHSDWNDNVEIDISEDFTSWLGLKAFGVQDTLSTFSKYKEEIVSTLEYQQFFESKFFKPLQEKALEEKGLLLSLRDDLKIDVSKDKDSGMSKLKESISYEDALSYIESYEEIKSTFIIINENGTPLTGVWSNSNGYGSVRDLISFSKDNYNVYSSLRQALYAYSSNVRDISLIKKDSSNLKNVTNALAKMSRVSIVKETSTLSNKDIVTEWSIRADSIKSMVDSLDIGLMKSNINPDVLSYDFKTIDLREDNDDIIDVYLNSRSVAFVRRDLAIDSSVDFAQIAKTIESQKLEDENIYLSEDKSPKSIQSEVAIRFIDKYKEKLGDMLDTPILNYLHSSPDTLGFSQEGSSSIGVENRLFNKKVTVPISNTSLSLRELQNSLKELGLEDDINSLLSLDEETQEALIRLESASGIEEAKSVILELVSKGFTQYSSSGNFVSISNGTSTATIKDSQTKEFVRDLQKTQVLLEVEELSLEVAQEKQLLDIFENNSNKPYATGLILQEVSKRGKYYTLHSKISYDSKRGSKLPIDHEMIKSLASSIEDKLSTFTVDISIPSYDNTDVISSMDNFSNVKMSGLEIALLNDDTDVKIIQKLNDDELQNFLTLQESIKYSQEAKEKDEGSEIIKEELMSIESFKSQTQEYLINIKFSHSDGEIYNETEFADSQRVKELIGTLDSPYLFMEHLPATESKTIFDALDGKEGVGLSLEEGMTIFKEPVNLNLFNQMLSINNSFDPFAYAVSQNVRVSLENQKDIETNGTLLTYKNTSNGGEIGVDTSSVRTKVVIAQHVSGYDKNNQWGKFVLGYVAVNTATLGVKYSSQMELSEHDEQLARIKSELLFNAYSDLVKSPQMQDNSRDILLESAKQIQETANTHIQDMINEKDFESLLSRLSTRDNKASRKAFTSITGLEFSKATPPYKEVTAVVDSFKKSILNEDDNINNSETQEESVEVKDIADKPEVDSTPQQNLQNDYYEFKFLEYSFRGEQGDKSIYLSNNPRKRSLYGDKIMKGSLSSAFDVNNYQSRNYSYNDIDALKKFSQEEPQLVEDILDIEFEYEMLNNVSTHIRERWLQKNEIKFEDSYDTSEKIKELESLRFNILKILQENISKTPFKEIIQKSALLAISQDVARRSSPIVYKSREKMIEIAIDDFLNLAEGFETQAETEKLDTINSLLDDSIKFNSIPFLKTDGEKVIGHEGRHRAIALKERGFTSMPILINDIHLRWSEQRDENSMDYKPQLPQRLISEDSQYSIPHPITRENVLNSYYEEMRIEEPPYVRSEETQERLESLNILASSLGWSAEDEEDFENFNLYDEDGVLMNSFSYERAVEVLNSMIADRILNEQKRLDSSISAIQDELESEVITDDIWHINDLLVALKAYSIGNEKFDEDEMNATLIYQEVVNSWFLDLEKGIALIDSPLKEDVFTDIPSSLMVEVLKYNEEHNNKIGMNRKGQLDKIVNNYLELHSKNVLNNTEELAEEALEIGFIKDDIARFKSVNYFYYGQNEESLDFIFREVGSDNTLNINDLKEVQDGFTTYQEFKKEVDELEITSVSQNQVEIKKAPELNEKEVEPEYSVAFEDEIYRVYRDGFLVTDFKITDLIHDEELSLFAHLIREDKNALALEKFLITYDYKATNLANIEKMDGSDVWFLGSILRQSQRDNFSRDNIGENEWKRFYEILSQNNIKFDENSNSVEFVFAKTILDEFDPQQNLKLDPLSRENIKERYSLLSLLQKDNAQDVLDSIFSKRIYEVSDKLEIPIRELVNNVDYTHTGAGKNIIGMSVFSVDDSLKDIQEYIDSIKSSQEYIKFIEVPLSSPLEELPETIIQESIKKEPQELPLSLGKSSKSLDCYDENSLTYMSNIMKKEYGDNIDNLFSSKWQQGFKSPETFDKIRAVLANNGSINIHGDYDADGFFSAISMKTYIDVMKVRGGSDSKVNLSFSLRSDGYELPKEKYDKLSQNNELIIFTDTGSSYSYLTPEITNTLVIDHHPIEASQKSVSGYIYNPNLQGGISTSCGAVVYEMLMNEEIRQNGLDANKIHSVMGYINMLSAITLVSDMADMNEANGSFLKKSLETMNTNRDKFIFLDRMIGSEISSSTLSFNLINYVNSLARIDVPLEKIVDIFAVKILDTKNFDYSEDSHARSKAYAEMLSIHKIRQTLYKESEYQMMQSTAIAVTSNQDIISYVSPSEYSGFNGLLAQALYTKYGKNSVVMNDNGRGSFIGSARGFSAKESLNKTVEPMALNGTSIHVGGHSKACGISLPLSEYNSFKEILSSTKSAETLDKDDSYFMKIQNIDEFKTLVKMYGAITSNIPMLSKIYAIIKDSDIIISEEIQKKGWGSYYLSDNTPSESGDVPYLKIMHSINVPVPDDGYQILEVNPSNAETVFASSVSLENHIDSLPKEVLELVESADEVLEQNVNQVLCPR